MRAAGNSHGILAPASPTRRVPIRPPEEGSMLDIVMLATGLGSFVLFAAYVAGCARI